MVSLSVAEAQLFRLLASFFGSDQVIPHLSVSMACNGRLPDFVNAPGNKKIAEWAKKNKCLFTVIDQSDEPKLVVEFFSGFEDSVDPVEAEHQQYLKPILAAAGVRYITISNEEFCEVLDPRSSLDFCTLLEAKVADQSQSV